MKTKVKIITSSILTVVLALVCTFLCYRTDVKITTEALTSQTTFSAPNITTQEDNFKIMMVSDTHMSYFLFYLNNRTFSALDKMIEAEQPDLIVLNGDIIWSLFNLSMFDDVANYFESKDIPWAYNLGNHDAGGIGASETRLISLLDSYENCLFYPTYTNVAGDTNYNITLTKDGNIIYSLTFIDSGAKKIEVSQIDWYEWSIESINALAQTTVPNMVFTHVPMTQLKDIYESGEYEGEVYESVSIVSSQGELFEKMLSLGSTRAVFSSHDHNNNFWGSLENIYFKSCSSSGYSGYGRIPRSVNIINIDTNTLSFSCETKYYE